MPKVQALEYEANEPAFLRRLREGNAALDGRHNVQIPRARGGIGKNARLNMQGEDGEDDPVMVDESGNVVLKEDFNASEKAEKEKGKDDIDDHSTENDRQKADSQAHTEDKNVHSGFGKKRKAAKIVGEQTNDLSGDEATSNVKTLKESTTQLEDVVAQNREVAKKNAETASTTKKKKKKIKLAFDGED